jgi:Bacteriophage tail sheath protein
VPEYLAPGVYVEETSFRAPSIEGVGTTTTAFTGPTLSGPVGGMPYGGFPASGAAVSGSPSGGVPELLTSFGDFQNIYGGYDDLSLVGDKTSSKNRNYMAMAVKAFFDNGGSMLYVSRVYNNNAGSSAGSIDPGVASSGAASTSNVVVAARFPGASGNSNFSGLNQPVLVTLSYSKVANVANLPFGSLLGVPPSATATAPTLYSNGASNQFLSNAASPAALTLPPPTNLYLLTVKVVALGANGKQMVFDNLGLDPHHPTYIGSVLGINPPRHIDALQNQIYFNIGSTLNTASALYGALFGTTWIDPQVKGATPVPPVNFTLTGGNDGAEPVAANYTTALQYCEALEDVAIVATPGASIYTNNADILIGSLIPHVQRQRAYRVAILEAGPNGLDSDYETVRGQIDSSYCALYVPWVITPNPLAVGGTSIPAEVSVPPSGFLAGIYARNDTQNSVAKAPANEVVLGAVDLERRISFAEQAALNPLGINCIRFFPDRGYRVWGARTASSDSELKYVNVRRYLIYLEHSIDNGTQWAVFENNGPTLWARVKDSIDSFLNNEFVSGNLLGTSPSSAYFVRCDRTTMTQNDLDNGRMICLIGVALLKPAEFVIFRIGQMTANARS